MSVQAIGSSKALTIPLQQEQTGGNGPVESFGKYLEQAVSNLNSLQNQADTMVNKLATGEPVELHQVALAVEQSSLAFQLALQVRNKLVEAYQEVMRMQI
ncbi:MAG: flagellar hook-basal body complex protein FliE [Chloroflexi bacterium]|nr:flagellar hook-basal body complex protein FliE [Chloroflexota bacterium]